MGICSPKIEIRLGPQVDSRWHGFLNRASPLQQDGVFGLKNPKGRLELTWMGKDLALIPSEEGKYDYEWVARTDPRAAEVRALRITGSVGDSPQDNLLVTGDSGDVLRALTTTPEWADKYLGQVKLVYIDPPFNTDQAFEHYADSLEHSIWLTLMRDRLAHIHEMLRPDGSVWVHLDDAEVHRMRVLMDEVFGPENFVATVVWQKVHSRDNRTHISTSHDSILVYSKCSPSKWKHVRNLLPHTGAGYANLDNDPRGLWTSDNFSAKAGPGRRASQFYKLTTPAGKEFQPPDGRCWLFTEDRYRELLADNRVWFGKNGTSGPRLKRFLSEVQDGMVPLTWWPHSEVGTNDTAKKEIKTLFPGQTPFDTPKPEALLERVIHIGSDPGDLVLDCFAGSGTTAAVAHKMGRRWLATELLESTVRTFTRPRLEKVVAGEQGGISTIVQRVPADDVLLPDGVAPEEAAQMLSTVAKFAEEASEPEVFNVVLKELRARARTVTRKDVSWTGGGGFTSATLGPSMYEVDDDGSVYLSENAVGGDFARAVAGQLGFRLQPDDPVFCGYKGRTRLAVIDGVADQNVVRTVVASLDDEEKAVIVAKGVLENATTLLQELSPGSRIRKAPDDLFAKGTVK